jgi:hypothetical protein
MHEINYIPTFDTIQPNQIIVMLLSRPALAITHLVISHIKCTTVQKILPTFVSVTTTWMSMRSKRVPPKATIVHPCFKKQRSCPSFVPDVETGAGVWLVIWHCITGNTSCKRLNLTRHSFSTRRTTMIHAQKQKRFPWQETNRYKYT